MTMARFLLSIDSFTLRRYPGWYLAISWLLGLGVGGLLFRYTGSFLVSWMPLAAAGQLSILSLFLSTSLPFLLCAFGVLFHQPLILLTVCFFRAFLLAYILAGVYHSFGGSGWLIRWLLLFTPTFSCVLLYRYARHHISGLSEFSIWEFLCSLGFIAVLVAADYLYISPFLRQLLSY